jgi:hypothetical protein
MKGQTSQPSHKLGTREGDIGTPGLLESYIHRYLMTKANDPLLKLPL